MPLASRMWDGVRMWRLVLRSGAARTGRRRADHPFMSGLRTGQVVPHQGGHWPDAGPNTIEAFRRAAEVSQVLDLDVWLTEDQVLVCAHDDQLELGGRISSTTWKELAATTSVPRLIDVSTTFPDHRLNIEIKDARAINPIQVLLAEGELALRCCLSTFKPFLARALAGAVPRAAHTRPTARRAGRIWGSGDIVQTMTFVPDAAKGLGSLAPLVLRWFFSAGSPELVRRQIPIAARKGLPLFAWTVNEAEPLRALIDAGIGAVLSDRPELFDHPRPADQ